MDFAFIYETFLALIAGLPLTLELAFGSVLLGLCLALLLAVMRLSSVRLLDWLAQLYVFVFRGTPLLVQIFLIYFGLGQFPAVRETIFWPFLREPYYCALLALTLCTAAYGSEILRGGLLSVAHGQVEAARACGMPTLLRWRRILLPLALRQALPAYGNELISMVKSTSLVSIITLMEVTGIAARIIGETYRTLEVFITAGAIYLALNFILALALRRYETWLTPGARPLRIAPASEEVKEDIR